MAGYEPASYSSEFPVRVIIGRLLLNPCAFVEDYAWTMPKEKSFSLNMIALTLLCHLSDIGRHRTIRRCNRPFNCGSLSSICCIIDRFIGQITGTDPLRLMLSVIDRVPVEADFLAEPCERKLHAPTAVGLRSPWQCSCHICAIAGMPYPPHAHVALGVES